MKNTLRRLVYIGFDIEISSKSNHNKWGKHNPKDDLEVKINGGSVDCIRDGVIDKEVLNRHIKEVKYQAGLKRAENFKKQQEMLL